jgi:hypothetical protein
VDDVVELLESMSKTQAPEKTMSMVDFAPPDAQRRTQAAGGDGAAGHGSGGGVGFDVVTSSRPPPSHGGFGLGGGPGVQAGRGLVPIAELAGGGASSGPGGLGMGRSMSVPAMPTMKRPSSMMLTEYFTSIAEESAKGGGKKTEEEGDEGVWF